MIMLKPARHDLLERTLRIADGRLGRIVAYQGRRVRAAATTVRAQFTVSGMVGCSGDTYLGNEEQTGVPKNG